MHDVLGKAVRSIEEDMNVNVMIAASLGFLKKIASKIGKGTIDTTMVRNRENFGVRIPETGNKWYNAPVNQPDGLYFTGYSSEDANKHIGDSSTSIERT